MSRRQKFWNAFETLLAGVQHFYLFPKATQPTTYDYFYFSCCNKEEELVQVGSAFILDDIELPVGEICVEIIQNVISMLGDLQKLAIF